MLDSLIKNTFGIDCSSEEIRLKGLPLYLLSGRKIYKVTVGSVQFILVELQAKDRFGAVALQKQMAIYYKKTEMDVAFAFSDFSKVQRDALISRGIPFIAGTDQVYLPFLGILFRNNFKKKMELPEERMMPATQSLFLYLLYSKRDFVIKKQAAEELNLTGTSITRASGQLRNMKLLLEEQRGKEIYMKLVADGLEMYKMAENYLINPVQKVIYVEGAEKYGLLAGESVLSRHSMLSEQTTRTYALYKGSDVVSQLKEIDPKWQTGENICRLELWKYDPELFAVDGEVDPVSLAKSLSDNDDERVQGELEDFMEEYKW